MASGHGVDKPDQGGNPNRQPQIPGQMKLPLLGPPLTPQRMPLTEPPDRSTRSKFRSEPAAMSGHPNAVMNQRTYNPDERQFFEDRYRKGGKTRQQRLNAYGDLQKHYKRAHGMTPDQVDLATGRIQKDWKF